jgi:hypothetical protein
MRRTQMIVPVMALLTNLLYASLIARARILLRFPRQKPKFTNELNSFTAKEFPC